MKRKLREALRRILSIVLMIVMLPLSSLQPAFTAIVHAEGTDDYVAETPASDSGVYSTIGENEDTTNPSEEVVSQDETDDTTVPAEDVTLEDETDLPEDTDETNTEEVSDGATMPADGDETTAEEDGAQSEEGTEETTVIIDENVDIIEETVYPCLAGMEDVVIDLGLKAVINEYGNGILEWNKLEDENAVYFVYRNDELIDSFSLNEENASSEEEESVFSVDEEGKIVSYTDSNTAGGTDYSYKVESKNEEIVYGDSEVITVSTPNSLTIEENGYISLTSDMNVFEVDLKKGAYLYLNGYKLTVCKNVICSGSNSSFNIDRGSLICYGDLNVSNWTAYFNMTSEQDYVYVVGNVNFTSSSRTKITNGVFEIAGDIKSEYFITSGNNRVVFSGSELQTIEIYYDGSACIEYLIDRNTSEEGISFTEPIVINGYEYNDDAKVSIYGEEVKNGFTLYEDKTIDGNFSIGFGILDLNGYTLTINGNFIQKGGDVVVGNGKLIVKGDYSLTNERLSQNGELQKASSSGRLIMDDDAGRVLVEGKFTTRYMGNGEGQLTAGTLELKGDFVQDFYSSSSNFRPSGSHTVLLSGDSKQMVHFDRSNSNYSYFNNLEITNDSEEGIEFDSKGAYPLAKGIVNDNGNVVTGTLAISDSTTFVDNHYSSDLIITEKTTISADIETDGNFTLGSGGDTFSNDIFIYGKLTIGEDMFVLRKGTAIYSDILVKENLYIGGERFYDDSRLCLYKGSLTVNGDVDIQSGSSSRSVTINQNYDADGSIFTVKGDVRIGANTRFWGDGGTFICNGDIRGQGKLQFSGSHKTIFNGEGLQRIEVDNSSYFASVEINNSSEEGVSFRDSYSINDLSRKGNKLSYDDMNGVFGWVLEENTVIDDDLVLLADTLDLNGYTLEIKGNLIQHQGTVYVNGGELIIHGDYRVQDEQTVNGQNNYISSSGKLKMTNDKDHVLVYGDFYFQSSNQHKELLTAGELELKGDFRQIEGVSHNFNPSGSHTVVFSGNEKQTVNFDYSSYNCSYFNNLEIRNKSEEGVTFEQGKAPYYPYAKGIVNDNGNKINGYLAIVESTSFENNHYCSDIIIYDKISITNEINTDGSMLCEDYVDFLANLAVGGNLSLQYYRFHLKSDVTVNENLLIGGKNTSNIYLHIDNGSLTVNGDIEAKRISTWEEIIIYQDENNENVPVVVKGNLNLGEACTYYGYYGNLSVNGNITGAGKIQCDNSHKTILNGKTSQRIDINKESYFGTVEINNTSEEGISCLYFYNINNLIRNGNNISYDGISGRLGWTLNTDTTIDGDLVLVNDTLDLNGYKLKITGNLIQYSGEVFVNGGELIVDGDYSIQKEEKIDDISNYVDGNGKLRMTNKDDRVLVCGDFIYQSIINESGLLTEGILNLKGDFYQIAGSSKNFRATDNHTVVFSGNSEQTVKFSNSDYYDGSYFNNIEIQNESEEGVIFDTEYAYPLAIGNIKDNDNIVHGALSVYGSTTFEKNHYCSDIIVKENITLPKKIEIDGDLFILGRSVDVFSDIHVKGNLYVGGENTKTYFRLYQGIVTVDGDFVSKASNYNEYARIYQDDYYFDEDDSSLIIKGNAFLDDYCYFSGYGGTLTIGGNVSGSGSFQLESNHKTIFASDDLQVIELSLNSYFAQVEIKNFSESGIVFNRMIKYDSLTLNGSKVSFGENSYELGWKLTENEEIDSNLYLWGGTLDLNGYTLTINGNFYAMGGVVDFNGGKMVVNGDFRLQTIDSGENGNIVYGLCTSKVIMDNASDRLLVNGGFYYWKKHYSSNNKDVFSDGIIEIKGDFNQDGNSSFIATGNNTVKFTGNTKQCFTADYETTFANYVNENTEEFYGYPSIYVTKSLVDKCNNTTGKPYYYVQDPSIVQDGFCGGHLRINEGCTLQNDLTVGGSLSINKGDFHSNGKNISADYLNVYSTLYVEKSKIATANGIYVGTEGKIVMINDEDYIFTNGYFDFYSQYDHSEILTAGTLEVRGNFSQGNYENFIASGTHTTILNPKDSTNGIENVQNVYFRYNPGTTRFNKVILKKKDSSYYFSPSLSEISNEVVYDYVDEEAPTAVQFITQGEITEQSITIIFGGAEDNKGILGYEIHRDGKQVGKTNKTTYKDSTVDPGKDYTYTVFAFDEDGNKAPSSPVLTVRTLDDSELPSVPQNLGIKTRTGSSITIEWSPSTDNVEVDSYNIYSNGILLADKVYNTYYKAKDLNQSQIYKFSVKAVDKAGNLSESSSEIEAEVKMPSIISVTPDDYQRIGGNNTTLSVYFENVGNSTGNRVNIQMKNDEGKWVTLASKLTQKTASGNRLYASYVWDISEYEGEKSIDIRYVLTDADGNETIKDVTYVIDKEAPEAPTGLKAEPNNGNVNISFNPSASADCTKYEIHRVNYGGDDVIATLSGKNSVYYTDKDVAIGGTYEYYVYAFDSFYNKSSASERVTVTIEEDNVVPEIINVSPRAGRVNSNLKLEVLASDNKGVSVIGIQYKAEEATEWIDIEEKEASEGKAVFTFDTTTLADGDYFINAYAIDGSGNRSTELFTRRYSIDNTGVEKIVVSEVTSGVSFVRIEWEDVNDDNFGYFAVEQLIEGEYEQVAEESSTLGCHINNLDPNTEYTFRVVGYDDLGNRGTESDEIVVSTTEDNVGPQITAVYPKASNYNGILKLEMDANDENELDYAVFSYSYDGKDYTEIDKVKAKTGNKEEHFLKNFDLSEISEGLIYVKFEVYDKAGNKNLLTKDDEDLIVEYNIDKTAPSKVKNLQSKSNAGSVELVWEKASEEETDVKGFKIWRADTSDGVYSVIKDEINTLNYFDYSVKVGSIYMYKVAAIDVAGNVGEESDEIIVTVNKDNEIPRVLGIYPKDNSTICANQVFSITSMDNASVASVRLEYTNDENNNYWKIIDSVSAYENYCISDITWDTEKIEEGEYSIRAIATDIYGNESDAIVNKYVLDKTAPVISKFETETGHFEIKINVNVNDENDFAKMDVLRREVGGEFIVIGKVDSLSFTDDDVKPNKNYIYKVGVYDKAGNITVSEESIGVADDIDVVAPTAVLPENYVGLVGMEIGLDGLASYDNVRITKYTWNMGDGNTVSGAIAKYTYKTAGTYTVKLTVEDAAGNKSSVSTTAKIYGKEERDEKGNLLFTRGRARVQVVDEDGKGIPYALVYLKNKEYPNGESLMTDGNGYIDIVQEAGGAIVAAYKTNYLPKQQQILVSAYEVLSYKIVLTEDQLIVGNLSVHRMSLEEMVGVGVSFDNDANKHKFVFEITLVYEQKEYGVSWIIDGDGSGAPCGSGHIETSGGGHIEFHAEMIEDQPILVFVNKRDEISWLKEMYQVDLTIVNMADFQFYIEGATASLSYPSGVSLADYTGPKIPQSFSNMVPIGSSGSTNTSATAVTSVSYPTYAHTSSASIGRIYGQEQKKVSWILRGDKSGEYNVAADFHGILMPFEAPVSAHFETEAAFQVTTGEGIHITVMPEYTVDAGGELYIQYAVTNISDHPIYGFETTIQPYEEPDQIYSIVDVNTGQVYEAIYRNGQCVYYHNDFEEGKEGNGKIHVKDPSKSGQSIASNGAVKLDVIYPGQSYYGTYVHQMPEAINPKDGKKYYFQFVEGFVNCLQGEDLGVTVSISPIPGHFHRDFYGKPQPMFPFLYDPVDVTSGYYQDDVEAMNIIGGQNVGYDLSYSSGNAEYDGEIGYGWSNEYEIYIEQQNGVILLHTSPSGTIRFSKKETEEKVICVVENEEGEWELDGEADYSIGEYYIKSSGVGEFKLTRNPDLTYTLTYPGGLIKKFNADGKLSQMISTEKQTVSFAYDGNNTIIKEDISGKTITAVHDENGLVTEVYDNAGRVTYLVYDDNSNLIAVIRPDGTQLKYSYDEKHRIIQASNDNGVFVTNEYDDKNRVVNQTDALNNLMSLSYEDVGDGNTKITGYNANGTTQTVYAHESGLILQEISEKGAKTTYRYDDFGNLVEEIDPYDNVVYKEYDEKDYITKIVDKGKSVTNFSYDSRGNVTSIYGTDGTTGSYTYDEKNNLTSYKDPLGMITTYTYDSNSQVISETKGDLGSTQYGYTNGLLTSVTDPLGNVSYIEYDACGNPIKTTDSNGHSTTYTFDAGGKKLSETDALGNTTYYTYDFNGNCTSVTDALGNVTKYEYDAMSHLTKEKYADGSEISYEYDSVGNCVKRTLPGGAVETVEYDECNHVKKITSADGTTTSYTYDLLGQKTSETDKYGRTNSFEYYPNGSIYKTTFADGSNILYTYNQRWKCTTKLYSDGSSEYTTYDNNGNVTSITDSLGNTVKYEYDIYSRLIKETDANGNVTKYTYDSNGNCISKTDAIGRTVHMVYDAVGQLVEVYMNDSNGEKYSVKYEYDALGRVISTTDEAGYTTKVTYDALGNVKSTIDANGNETDITTYDSVGRVKSVQQSDGTVTNYTYDERGNILSAIQNLSGINKSSKYSYDDKGRVISVKENDTLTTKVSYDDYGNVTSLTDANGGVTQYQYDSLARLTAVISSLGNKETYTYNAQGLVEEFKNARGQKTSYSYDLLGRVTSMTDELGQVKYKYDKNGNITEVEENKNNTKKTISRKYDKLNRVISYTDYNNNTINYAYDELGNLMAITYPGGEIVRYEYYKNGWLKKVVDNNGNATSYTYNALGQVTTCTRPNNTKEICSYDSKTGQLFIQREIKTDSNGAYLEEISNYVYTYDASGNISSVEGFDNNSEGLTSASFKYDSENRLIEYNGKEVRYDADGNMVYGPVNGIMTDLSYDCRNRLIYAGGVRYEYDAENTRIAEDTDEHRVEFVTDVVSGELSRVLVKKTYQKTNGEKSDNSIDRLYVYGCGLVSEIQGASTLYHHYNNIGSTMKLSDGSGIIIAEYSYGPYGELLEGNTKLTDYLYNGQYGVSTDENGLYYMRQRYYNSEIKRFINQDILTGEVGDSQSMNKYAYVEGNPINLMDPFGLSPEMTPWGIMSFIAHGVLGIVGCIPGIPGFIANVLDGAIYFAEGDYLSAGLCIISAACMGTVTIFAKAGCAGAKVAKGAMAVYQATNLVRNGIDLINNVSNLSDQVNNIATKLATHQKITAGDWFRLGFATAATIYSTRSAVTGSMDFVDAVYDSTIDACFVAGTKVQTIDGEKNIEEVAEGDYVLAENPETGEIEYKQVLQTFINENDVLVHVFVDGEEIITTPEHPFYVEGVGFVKAGELVEGDILRTADNENPIISKIEKEYFDECINVYNFEVEDLHTYFVSEKKIFVHNFCKSGDVKTSSGSSSSDPDGEKTYYHSCNDAYADTIAKDGFRIDLPSPSEAFNNNRYGQGVYLADSAATALAERPGGTILKISADIGNNLDLTSRGVIGGSDYSLPHSIARSARKHGYDSITYASAKNPSGVCTVIFDPKKVKVTEIVR